jgi:N-acyl-D-amino-acid deacylase
MKKYLATAGIIFIITGFTVVIHDKNDPEKIKRAINKGLPLLQSSSHTFLVNAGGCHSCHGQGLGAVAFSLAQEKGFVIQDTILKEALDSIQNDWTQRRYYLSQNQDPVAIVMAGGYDLWAMSASHQPSDKTKELLAKNILQRQRKNGSWASPNERPPLEYYSFSATALSIQGITTYLPAVFKIEVDERLARARKWLMITPAIANEEKVFQLLGLTWANADKKFIQQQAKKLLAAQHADGGWSQLDALPTDAYATGQSLYALYRCGQLATGAPAYQKGIAYLLQNQQPDGSWKIVTRSYPSVPYVNSGFPHDTNQFISAAGSNWAVMALLVSQ